MRPSISTFINLANILTRCNLKKTSTYLGAISLQASINLSFESNLEHVIRMVVLFYDFLTLFQIKFNPLLEFQ